jgi:distribution and morphology protein 12
MSIDLNWETVTGGPDGQELADKIRDFIHTKFQSVPLPRFIQSVTVHDFQFGNIPPEIELKDITDPLPDFYEDHVESDLASDSSEEEEVDDSLTRTPRARDRRPSESKLRANAARNIGHLPPYLMFGGPGGHGVGGPRNGDLSSPFLRGSTPGIPGGTSSLHYFHSHLASGLSGTQTPLAAVAGAQHLSTVNWLEGHGHSSSVPNLHQYGASLGSTSGSPHQFPEPNHIRNPSHSSISSTDFSHPAATLGPPLSANLTIPTLREKHSVSTLGAGSTGASRPPTRDAATALMGSAIADDAPEDGGGSKDGAGSSHNGDHAANGPRGSGQQPPPPELDEDHPRFREPRLDDMQAVFRIRYAGDVKLLLTADILLDYPMPSFVGIPVRLSITGLTFDGVGVLAKIRKRVHFCFLSPEDAVAAVGDESGVGAGEGQQQQQQQEQRGRTPAAGATKLGGLLQEIRVESEIGQRESGKQSLKNVGKVERFVLEQVRRIFEEEFVYPSFWTFLV